MNNLFVKILNFFKSIFNFNLTDFSWIKTSKFIELDNIDVTEDPVRPVSYTHLTLPTTSTV